MITRIVKVKLKENFLADFLAYMETFAKNTSEFTNNHHVDYFADKDEPLHYHIYTIWKTEGALNKFSKSDIRKDFKKKLTSWCENPYSAWTVENV